MKPELFFALFTDMTGLTLNDIIHQETRKTEKEKEKARVDNYGKMYKYINKED